MDLSVEDCASDDFFNLFKKISRKNTFVYDEVFKSVPSDNIKTMSDMTDYLRMGQFSMAKTNPTKVSRKKYIFTIKTSLKSLFKRKRRSKCWRALMDSLWTFRLNFSQKRKTFFQAKTQKKVWRRP